MGVIPVTLVVATLLFPQAGMSRNDAPNTNRASNPHTLRERFFPIASPNPANASMGSGSQIAYKSLLWAEFLSAIGPTVLIEITDVVAIPVTATTAGSKEHMGGIVTSGVMEAHDRVTLPV